MKQNKEHQITRLILWSVNKTCNLSCSYCSSQSERERYRKICALKTSQIDLNEISRFFNSTKEKYFVIMTGGGEPFLTKNIIEALQIITKKHFIGLNTNLTSSKIPEFVNKIDASKVIHIVASLHIDELKRRNLLDTYISNYKLCEEKGFNIIASEVAHPSILKEIKQIRKEFAEKGVELRFDPFLGIFEGKEYPKAYTASELKLLRIKKEEVSKFYVKDKYCNAGFNACVVDSEGNADVCPFLKENIGSISSGIKFEKHGIYCPLQFCGCPLLALNKELYKKSLAYKPGLFRDDKKFKNYLKLKKKYAKGNVLAGLRLFGINIMIRLQFIPFSRIRWSNLKFIYKSSLEQKLGKIGDFLRRINPKLYLLAKKVELFFRGK